jgi:hypothetical protein
LVWATVNEWRLRRLSITLLKDTSNGHDAPFIRIHETDIIRMESLELAFIAQTRHEGTTVLEPLRIRALPVKVFGFCIDIPIVHHSSPLGLTMSPKKS